MHLISVFSLMDFTLFLYHKKNVYMEFSQECNKAISVLNNRLYFHLKKMRKMLFQHHNWSITIGCLGNFSYM